MNKRWEDMTWYDRHPHIGKYVQAGVALLAVLSVGAALAIYETRRNNFNDMPHNDYTVQPGDVLSSICAREGAEDIDGCATHICSANAYNRMPGTTRPVFATKTIGDILAADCDALQAGAVITVPDVNENGRAGE